MIPLSEFKSCRAHDLPFGAFAWLSSGDRQEIVIVANKNDPFGVVLADQPFIAGMHNLDGDAIYLTDWSIEVDARSAKSANQSDSNHHVLKAGKDMIHLLVKNPGGVGWGHAELPINPDFPVDLARGMAFTRWRIVTKIDKETHTLFEAGKSLSDEA